MEFNWKQNIPDLAAIQQRNAEARRQAAQAAEDSVMNGPNAWMVKPFEQNAAAEAEAEAFQNSSQAYNQVMQNQMAKEAQETTAKIERFKQLQQDMEQKKQRLAELKQQENERWQKYRDDPRFQVAAMLAAGGNGGALQSLIVSDLQKEIQEEQRQADAKKAAQRELDALESSLGTSMMVLSKTDKDQIDRFKSVTLPLFWNKFHELTDAGAVSRMGGVDAWNEELKNLEDKGNTRLTRAQMQKEFDRLSVKNNRTAAEDKRMAYLAEQLRKK